MNVSDLIAHAHPAVVHAPLGAVLFLPRPRGVRMALGLSLVWLALWGAAGHWGGRMVFRDPPAEAPVQ